MHSCYSVTSHRSLFFLLFSSNSARTAEGQADGSLWRGEPVRAAWSGPTELRASPPQRQEIVASVATWQSMVYPRITIPTTCTFLYLNSDRTREHLSWNKMAVIKGHGGKKVKIVSYNLHWRLILRSAWRQRLSKKRSCMSESGALQLDTAKCLS